MFSSDSNRFLPSGWIRTPVLVLLVAGILVSGFLAARELGYNIYSWPFLNEPSDSSVPPPDFTVTAVGDIMLARPIDEEQVPGYAQLRNFLRDSTVAFGNLEQVLVNLDSFSGGPHPNPDGAWFVGTPAVAEHLKTLGFDLLSRANNHAYDMGLKGLRETARHLDAAGVRHAGSGGSRAEAGSPVYLERSNRRYALVAATTNFPEGSSATDAPSPLSEAWSHAGVHSLRTEQYISVGDDELDVLRKITRHKREGSREKWAFDPERNIVYLPGVNFQRGDSPGLRYTLNSSDRKEFLESVREADQNADHVMVSIHAHQPGNDAVEPPDFLRNLARSTIEAGADQVLGHGPHILRGIEIYDRKPIFYSLGSFLFQFEQLHPERRENPDSMRSSREDITFPPEVYETLGITRNWYESVLVRSHFTDQGLDRIRLVPITLGYEDRGISRGIPRRATGQQARDILHELEKRSRVFGTTIHINEGTGTITLEN